MTTTDKPSITKVYCDSRLRSGNGPDRNSAFMIELGETLILPDKSEAYVTECTIGCLPNVPSGSKLYFRETKLNNATYYHAVDILGGQYVTPNSIADAMVAAMNAASSIITYTATVNAGIISISAAEKTGFAHLLGDSHQSEFSTLNTVSQHRSDAQVSNLKVYPTPSVIAAGTWTRVGLAGGDDTQDWTQTGDLTFEYTSHSGDVRKIEFLSFDSSTSACVFRELRLDGNGVYSDIRTYTFNTALSPQRFDSPSTPWDWQPPPNFRLTNSYPSVQNLISEPLPDFGFIILATNQLSSAAEKLNFAIHGITLDPSKSIDTLIGNTHGTEGPDEFYVGGAQEVGPPHLEGLGAVYLTSQSLGSLNSLGPSKFMRSVIKKIPIVDATNYTTSQLSDGGHDKITLDGVRAINTMNFRVVDVFNQEVNMESSFISFTLCFARASE